MKDGNELYHISVVAMIRNDDRVFHSYMAKHGRIMRFHYLSLRVVLDAGAHHNVLILLDDRGIRVR